VTPIDPAAVLARLPVPGQVRDRWWFDFLACRSPRTSRLELTWRDRILSQRVGDALRHAITGR
jgi:hypothetical protein